MYIRDFFKKIYSTIEVIEKMYSSIIILSIPIVNNIVDAEYISVALYMIPSVSILLLIILSYYNFIEYDYLTYYNDFLWIIFTLLIVFFSEDILIDNYGYEYFGLIVSNICISYYFFIYYRLVIIINTLLILSLYIKSIISNTDKYGSGAIIAIQYSTALLILIFILLYLKMDIDFENIANSNKNYDQKIMRVAHDLKNPLLAIQQLSNDENTDFNDSRKDIYEEATEGIEMLDDLRIKFKVHNNMLIQEELDYVEIEQYVLTLKNAHINLALKCKCTLNFQKENQFDCDYTIHVSIKKTIVKRILNNFITNAIKHSVYKEVNVSTLISPKEMNEERVDDYIHVGDTYNELEDYLVFTIADSGSGIDPKKMYSIFNEEFSDEKKENWDGTGLGLPICKKLCQKIGASIFYKSEINKGSVFKLFVPLPFYQVQKDEGVFLDVANNSKVSSESRKSTDNNCLFSEFLIAEDNYLITKIYTNYLKKKKIPYRSFSNGQECRDYVYSNIANNDNFILFTDNHMPAMTGLELAREIRLKYNNCKIILISADEFQENEDNLFDKVFEKPFQLSNFEKEYKNFYKN